MSEDRVVEGLAAEVQRLREGIADLRDRIAIGATELDRMGREATTRETSVRLYAKAEGMRVTLDYIRLLETKGDR